MLRGGALGSQQFTFQISQIKQLLKIAKILSTQTATQQQGLFVKVTAKAASPLAASSSIWRPCWEGFTPRTPGCRMWDPPPLHHHTAVGGRLSAWLMHWECDYCSLSKTHLNRGSSKTAICDAMDLHLLALSAAKPPLSTSKHSSQRNELETSVGPCSVPMKGSLTSGMPFVRLTCHFQDFPLQLWILRGTQVGCSIPPPKLLFAENSCSQSPPIRGWWKTWKEWEI